MEESPRVSLVQSPIAEETLSKTRRKRKWDQPAESFESSPGPSSANLSVYNGSSSFTVHAPAIQKPCQIHDEIIAREIVINDAEASVRYILTKRQTQEDIHTCTGAVVITRGKYRPPNSPSDAEKPLYLHISSGGHLREIADRIIALDRATSVVEEILKNGQNSHFLSVSHTISRNCENVSQPLSICVFLGFNADPSLNICTRIRGPSDQYINHIMNETGATVLLRGLGSGNSENAAIDVSAQLPLHLFLSSYSHKNLEDARLLAENLLDTICSECGTSRMSSSNACRTFSSSQHLFGGVTRPGFDHNMSIKPSPELLSLNAGLISMPSVTSVPVYIPQVPRPRISGLFAGQTQPSTSYCSQPTPVGGTSYSGYGGIYPQATPLQQVALALRNSNFQTNSAPAPDKVKENPALKTPSPKPHCKKEKPPPPRRKFQELPIPLKSDAKLDQNIQVKKNDPCTTYEGRNEFLVPAPRSIASPCTPGSMPPPPPIKIMPPPPSPMKYSSPTELMEARGNKKDPMRQESNNITGVSETLIKLMEYGEDEDDEDDGLGNVERSGGFTGPKPFWAV